MAIKSLEVELNRTRSNSSLVSRANRSRSNSFKPRYDDSGRPISNEFPQAPDFSSTKPERLHAPSESHNNVFKIQRYEPTSRPVSIVTDSSQLHPHKSTDNPSVFDQEIKRVNKSHEDSGIFSSIINMAHNTANFISHKDHDKLADERDKLDQSDDDNFSSFSNKLDALINDKLDALRHDLPEQVRESKTSLSPSNVAFSPIRESPVNTLGAGDLSLNDFQESRKDSMELLVPGIGPGTVAGGSNGGDAAQDGADGGTPDEDNRKRLLKHITNDGSDDEPPKRHKLRYASSKRNGEFHHIFRKVPKTDRLIDDFSCALSKDILVQGRMYLSQHYICFKSNILGWVTNLHIPLQEVIQIEKRSTAVLFPNGMIIKTLHQKYTFATFLSRDTTFDLLTKVWHRVLMEREGGRVIGSDSSFRTETTGYSSSDEESEDIDDEESVEEEDDSGELNDNSVLSNDQNSVSDNDNGDDDEESSDTPMNEDTEEKDSAGTFKGLPLLGPQSHEPTSNEYEKGSNDTFIVEDTFLAPMGVVFSLLFGKDSSYYIKILKNQKNFDIEEEKIVGLEKEGDERNYKYIKPLGGSIGPKQTSCLITDKILKYDLQKTVLVEQTTSTPDVPSGNAFKIRTKIFLSWGENNGTKMYVITQIEWSGKSWIKGPIEKGSIDGQKESMHILIDTVSDLIKNGASAGKRSASKKRSRSKTKDSRAETSKESTPPPPVEKTLPEKILDVVESIGSLVPIPMVPATVTGAFVVLVQLLVVIHMYNWIFGTLSISVLSNSIKVDEQKFYLIPSVENAMHDDENVRRSQVSLWKWINDKSDEKIKFRNPGVDEITGKYDFLRLYKDQELRDIVGLAQMRIDELNGLLAG